MQEELKFIQENDVWDLVDLPHDLSLDLMPIECTWAHKPNGIPDITLNNSKQDLVAKRVHSAWKDWF